MRNLGELLIQSLQDAIAFEEGNLDARIQSREMIVRGGEEREKKTAILQSHNKHFTRLSASIVDKGACGE